MARDVSLMPGDIRKRIDRMAKASQRAAAASVASAAEAGAAEHEDRIKRDSGGDGRLSGVNRAKGRTGGARVGTKVKILNRTGTNVSAEVSAVGPLQLIANDTSGRVIRSAYSRGRYRKGGKGKSGFIGPTVAGQFKGDRRAVLNIPGIGYRRSARHPGTRGKDTWNKAMPDARRAISQRIGIESDRVMTSEFLKGA